MKLLRLSFILLGCFFLNFVYADCDHIYEYDIDGSYIGFKTGAAFMCLEPYQPQFNPGFFIDGYIGYKVERNYRFEAEINYQRSVIKKDHRSYCRPFCTHGYINFLSGQVNVIRDFDLNFPLKPYIGFGFGYGHARGKWYESSRSFDFFYSRTKISYETHGFAWQSILGVNYQITPTLRASLDFRSLALRFNLLSAKLGLALTQEF